ncbi:CBS domain-containing protein [Neobacillus sp. YIM B06451]|uniref:CBS domain-containing protein n=1 Tax=Neobacillus sp. YIM B06451 TaxID=3070994 RepID=UPI00292F3440|nr:CBS domain-containing protein [Neobacillus sp. YIM B06451]
MKNSERFLSAFNLIEKHISRKRETSEYVPFKKAIEKAVPGDPIIRRYQYDLLEFADLRNAIVHERTDPNFVIAEPHDSTVLKIERIQNELINPKLVLPAFGSEVIIFQTNNSLTDMLKMIREKAFSQFPIYNRDNFVGLISENGITNWLAKHVEEDVFSLMETSLESILDCEENKDNFHFISRNTTVIEAEEIFKDFFANGSKIDALLITHNGKSTESLLGIITTWDIINGQ